jgi:glutamyl-tRNA reductase
MGNHIPLIVIGISHKTAPVEIRDKVALNDEEQKMVLNRLKEEFKVDGCMVLSTCNRTEIYLSGDELDKKRTDIMSWLNEVKECSYFTDPSVSYEKTGVDSVHHFFEVIAGIDSQIVGEVQITGQVKESYNLAHEQQATDSIINKLYNFGMQSRKKVFSDTYLYEGTVSVSFAAVELARKIFSDLDKKEILLIGAGKTAELAAFHFLENGVKKINVVNRTFKKAEELADKFNGHAFSLDDMPQALKTADIVISATSSKEYVVTPGLIVPILRERNHQPIFMIDLAIPRDIDPAVNSYDSIYSYNLDDLEEIVKINLKNREKEIPKAMKIVDEYLTEYRKWISTHSMTSVIGKLKKRLDALRLNELERLKNKLPPNGYKDEINYLTESIVNKVIRQHVKSLKKNASNPELYQQHLDLIYNLFELDDDND